MNQLILCITLFLSLSQLTLALGEDPQGRAQYYQVTVNYSLDYFGNKKINYFQAKGSLSGFLTEQQLLDKYQDKLLTEYLDLMHDVDCSPEALVIASPNNFSLSRDWDNILAMTLQEGHKYFRDNSLTGEIIVAQTVSPSLTSTENILTDRSVLFYTKGQVEHQEKYHSPWVALPDLSPSGDIIIKKHSSRRRR